MRSKLKAQIKFLTPSVVEGVRIKYASKDLIKLNPKKGDKLTIEASYDSENKLWLYKTDKRQIVAEAPEQIIREFIGEYNKPITVVADITRSKDNKQRLMSATLSF